MYMYLYLCDLGFESLEMVNVLLMGPVSSNWSVRVVSLASDFMELDRSSLEFLRGEVEVGVSPIPTKSIGVVNERSFLAVIRKVKLLSPLSPYPPISLSLSVSFSLPLTYLSLSLILPLSLYGIATIQQQIVLCYFRN